MLLAIVFLAGTFAAITPSFIIGVNAQAEPYGMDHRYNSYEPDYGMDNSYDNKQSYGKDSNSYDKSKDSSTIVKKEKCNNINVNVNGFNGIEVGTLPTALNGLATNEAQAADEGEVGASSSGSDGGRPSGSDIDSRICINNNAFAVVEEESPVEDECPEADEIKSCFEEFLVDTQLPRLVDALNLPAGVTVEINGQEVTLRSFEDICEALKGVTTFDDLREAIRDILTAAFGQGEPINGALNTCIAEALDIPVPPR
jgi:hypothetical protein